MSDIIKVKYSGPTKLIRGAGIPAQQIKEGDIIDMPKSTYEKELKNNTQFTPAVSRGTSGNGAESKKDGASANKKEPASSNKSI